MIRRYPPGVHRRTVRPGRSAHGTLLMLAAAVLAVLASTTPAARAEVPVIRVDGVGFGHGVGLSQHGARAMALQGATAHQIISHFYPGTELSGTGGTVRVVVLNGGPVVEVTFPDGGELRSPRDGTQSQGFPVAVAPGGSVRIGFDGSYYLEGHTVSAQSPAPAVPAVLGQADPSQTTSAQTCPDDGDPDPTTGIGDLIGATDCHSGPAPAPDEPLVTTTTTTAAPTTTAPTTTTTAPAQPPPAPPETTTAPADTPPDPEPPPQELRSASPIWAVPNHVTTVPARGRSYRGHLEIVAGGDGLRVLNEVDVETYLRGLGELPASWPVEAHAAQAIAARTYALRAMSYNGEICDYDRCQVYVGVSKENANQNAGVDATSGQVVRYHGALASTVYSSDAGGITATTQEGFGTPQGVHPYLTTVRYENPDPITWTRDVSLADTARLLGYAGTITDVAVAKTGPSGRPLAIRLSGDAGDVDVPALEFVKSLGLRSTKFTVGTATADVAPPPPAQADLIQAAPDDAESIAHATRDGARPRAPEAPAPAGGDSDPTTAETAAAGLGLLLIAAVTGAAHVHLKGPRLRGPSGRTLPPTRLRFGLGSGLGLPMGLRQRRGENQMRIRRRDDDLPEEWADRDLEGWAEMLAADDPELALPAGPVAPAPPVPNAAPPGRFATPAGTRRVLRRRQLRAT